MMQEIITIRLLISLCLGFLVGLERQWNYTRNNLNGAGLKTHTLICLGSTIFTILSVYGFEQYIGNHVSFDPSRIAGQILTGIGFMGAGAIFKDGNTVRGLTTAGTIWVISAIGVAVGVGFYYLAVLSTIITIVALIFEKQIEIKVLDKLSSNNEEG